MLLKSILLSTLLWARPENLAASDSQQKIRGQARQTIAKKPQTSKRQIGKRKPTSEEIPEDSLSLDESEGIEVEKPEVHSKSIETTANQFQMQMTRRVFTLSNRLDSFFGEKRADDEANLSTLRLVHSNYFSESGAQSEDFQARLNLRLKNVEDFGMRLQESILRFFEPDKSAAGSGGPGGTGGQLDKAREELKKWNLNWENRVGITRTLDLFSILRARRNFEGDPFTHRFYQEVGWSNIDEWQAVTSLNSDKEVTPVLLFRIINEFHWAMTAHTYTTTHGPSFIQSLDENNSISYDARFFTKEEEQAWYGEGSSLGVNFRRRFQNKWLFLDISPQVSFARATNFHRDLNITIRLEAAMGDL